ncbi:hypothetical protein HanRHA438_Chr16g0787571 [Helianthus annuus]|nr:hypothetical protein HanRHA438_Chr16g0787571 [Helianthus annuus]
MSLQLLPSPPFSFFSGEGDAVVEEMRRWWWFGEEERGEVGPTRYFTLFIMGCALK